MDTGSVIQGVQDYFYFIGGILLSFVVGYYVGEQQGKKKSQGKNRQKFCPHCGESLQLK